MRKLSLLIALLFVSNIAAAPISFYQEIQAGNWTGTATSPEEQVFSLVYEVKTEEGLAITIQIPEQGMVLPATEPKLEDAVLTFGLIFGDGLELNCALERQDNGSFHGECVDRSGGAGYLVMNPPQNP